MQNDLCYLGNFAIDHGWLFSETLGTFILFLFQAAIDAEVKTLLALKSQYKDLTGEELGGGGRQKDKKDKGGKKDKKPDTSNKENKSAENKDQSKDDKEIKKVTR